MPFHTVLILTLLIYILGRFEDSTILSELLYSASNLLILFNDAIIKKASGILPKVVSHYHLFFENLSTINNTKLDILFQPWLFPAGCE